MALRLDYAGRKPHQATPESAGLDLFASSETPLPSHQVVMVGTGTRLAIPNGFFGLLAIRSSLGAKGISLANGVGIIDADYRGEVKVLLWNATNDAYRVRVGDKIAQLIFVPSNSLVPSRISTEELKKTQRGEGGFGSTGR